MRQADGSPFYCAGRQLRWHVSIFADVLLVDFDFFLVGDFRGNVTAAKLVPRSAVQGADPDETVDALSPFR